MSSSKREERPIDVLMDRRRERKRARFARLDKLAAEVEEDPFRPNCKDGTPQSAMSVAIEIVAKEDDVSVRSILQQIRRHKRGNERALEKATAPPPVDDLGVEQSHQHMALVTRGKECLKLAATSCSSVSSFLSEIVEKHYPIPEAALAAVHDRLLVLRQHINDLIPEYVCPWCKGIRKLSEQCSHCHTTGVATKDLFNSAPNELRDPEKMLVLAHGRYTKASDHAEADPNAGELSDDMFDEGDELDDLWADEES